ncbi:unnamed protein product [Phytophthora fragariaefolia]|uniref:Unnamed protein product n=1 Tax=Phytophthora fragariaefolia TaxID=1490495 RepID=A0A9W6YFH2_9STRA|nr:unnamed protein product [Phytophthora fragariaefolia]
MSFCRVHCEYHEQLLQYLKQPHKLAAVALQKKQARRAIYYNRRNVRQRSNFRPGQLVGSIGQQKGRGLLSLDIGGEAQARLSKQQDMTTLLMLVSWREPVILLWRCEKKLLLYLDDEEETAVGSKRPVEDHDGEAVAGDLELVDSEAEELAEQAPSNPDPPDRAQAAEALG